MKYAYGYKKVEMLDKTYKTVYFINSRWLWFKIFFKITNSEESYNWTDYKNGCGSYSFGWFGNSYLHQLTADKMEIWNSTSRSLLGEAFRPGGPWFSYATTTVSYRLKVLLMDMDKQWFSAEYSCFYVHSESSNYMIEISGYSDKASDIGDGFGNMHSSNPCEYCPSPCYTQPFSAMGKGQYFDVHDGWWYNNLNSPYSRYIEYKFRGVLTSRNGWWPAKNNVDKIFPSMSYFYIANSSSYQ